MFLEKELDFYENDESYEYFDESDEEESEVDD